MKVVFRADASMQIGTGHIMRCLALAEALRAKGASSTFICREHPGHLADLIRARGFPVHALSGAKPGSRAIRAGDASLPAHADWLGADMQDDAQDVAKFLEGAQPHWLVVDHYALDSRWERELRGHGQRTMVIDDLADRMHDCDLLLDQNLGHSIADYAGLLPAGCKTAVGTRYALLRPEFAEWRARSLARREDPKLGCILVTMGGVDKDNATARVLTALAQSPLPDEVSVKVVLGPRAPWLREVRLLAKGMPWSCQVDAGVTDMARLMSESDLAIGAAGTTSWERCCLGVPSLIVVLAENQRSSAAALVAEGAAVAVGIDSLMEELPAILGFHNLPETMSDMTIASASLVDGRGVDRIVQLMSVAP